MVWTAERMYSQARALIPNEEGNFELGKPFSLPGSVQNQSMLQKTSLPAVGFGTLSMPHTSLYIAEFTIYTVF
jgi:hypothetical protein